MGACCQPQSEEDDDASHKEAHKILFLGTSSSGKSTLFKQARTICGKGFTHKDKKDARYGITACLVETMHSLMEDESYNADLISQEAKMAAKQINAIQTNASLILESELSHNLQCLWNQQLIKTIFEERKELYGNATTGYLFDQLPKWNIQTHDDWEQWEPTPKEILLQRRPTSGLIEQQIEYKNATFLMVDVGGTKNERRKWIHHFENVAGIIWIISLSSYNEPLYEDESRNALVDALECLRQEINRKDHWLKESLLFIVFNRKDLFDAKIVNQSLREGLESFTSTKNTTMIDQILAGYDDNEYFNESKSEQDLIEKNARYIQDVCLRQIERKPIKTYVSCAYDVEQARDIFDDILGEVAQYKSTNV